MDTRRFFAELPTHFAGDPQDHDPVDPAWEGIAQDVAGYTSTNELAVLNHAARLLPQDESYLEVGTFKGRSLCAAVRDVTDKKFYAMENFMEFGMAGEQARDELRANLGRHAQDADVELIEGDCFQLMARPGVVDRPVGVYFYDGEHTLLAHYLALAVAEPLLADEALVLVDDASWPVVQKAHRIFLRNHPGWSIEATWDAREADDPRWANGLHALVFRRTAPSRLGRRDQALLRYQTTVQDRVNAVGWKAAGLMPGVVKTGAKVFLSRSRAIGGGKS
ncbi:class I SAM-dependent methyltransferase [Luteipulveratus halotolerans]|uniref:Methyltransferase n=1 Tax=Luteipulveratus halotolerans TaxID=1631356 RepID=A0A0L6CIB8_9MICO|nr:class I SAM-dependent methyltransferase [Luteipulveratus halotolerans]KNX37258.1 hypothetical protein VV01_09060 [Luteipulveratus halotolerans]